MEHKGVAAVDRALAIIGAFEQRPEALTLAEIARTTGLYKSTVLRLLVSLKAQGFIDQTEDGRYRLGPAFLRLGSLYQRTMRLDEKILPELESLVAQGSESASFFIRHDAEMRICIFRRDSNHSTVDRIRTGTLKPIDRGAAGKVFRAEAGEPGDEFDRIRRAGHAVSFGETDRGCAAVAAPVTDSAGRVVGALSLSGPNTRFDEDGIARQLALLLPAAARLSHKFGGAAGTIHATSCHLPGRLGE